LDTGWIGQECSTLMGVYRSNLGAYGVKVELTQLSAKDSVQN